MSSGMGGPMRSAWGPGGHGGHPQQGNVMNRWQAAPSPRAVGVTNTEGALSPLRAAIAAAAAGGGVGGWGVQGSNRQYMAGTGQEALLRTSWGSGPSGGVIPAGEGAVLMHVVLIECCCKGCTMSGGVIPAGEGGGAPFMATVMVSGAGQCHPKLSRGTTGHK
jgi:hypothetical protein